MKLNRHGRRFLDDPNIHPQDSLAKDLVSREDVYLDARQLFETPMQKDVIETYLTATSQKNARVSLL